MPFVTEISARHVSVAEDGSVSITGSPSLSAALNASVEFSQYDVGAAGATTLSCRDDVGLIDSAGDPLTGMGTCLGSATIGFAPRTTVIGPIKLQIKVAPVTGAIIEVDGLYYLVTDDPLDNDHIEASVTLSLALPGLSRAVSATAPIAGLADAFADQIDTLRGPFATMTANFVHQLDDPFARAANGVRTTMTNDRAATLSLSSDEVICFVSGTLIKTGRGKVPVQDLAVGDMVWAKDHGFQPLVLIGGVRISAARLSRKPNLCPIRIRAGALGPNVPSTDLLVSPQHRILVRSAIAVKMFGVPEVLVPAKQLLQIDGIDYAPDVAEVEYFHFLFDRHQIVMSNRAETESLYTGPQALRSLSPTARDEILTLFPELKQADIPPEAIRPLPSGRKARKLAQRHAAKQRDLVC